MGFEAWMEVSLLIHIAQETAQFFDSRRGSYWFAGQWQENLNPNGCPISHFSYLQAGASW